MTDSLRIGFVTCVQLGLSCMEQIYEVGGRLDFAMTLVDTKAQRKSGRVFLDHFCGRHRIPLFKVANINDADAIEFLRAQRPDWLFIVGWSQIARRSVLEAVRGGVLGIHPTLLPVGRGRAAVPWAILKGLAETGVTLFQLDEGVDSGPILMQLRIPIEPRETATTLYAKVVAAHGTLMRRAWPELIARRLQGRPQDDSAATVWPGRTPADGRLDHRMSAEEMDRLVRATTRPYPGAFWYDGSRIVRVWSGRIAQPGAPTPAGAIRLTSSDGAFDALEYDVELLTQSDAAAGSRSSADS